MQVLAPGRMRLTPEYQKALAAQSADDRAAGYAPPLTETETEYNFYQALGMVNRHGPIAESPLLNRPLAVAAGGIYHAEAGDVFATATAPGYVALLRWASGAGTELCP